MLNHYIDRLTPEQEDAVLTTPMRPRSYTPWGELGPCLRGVAEGFDNGMYKRRPFAGITMWDKLNLSVEWRYDALCHGRLPEHRRDRTAYINDLIRARILRNRAWRALHQPAHEAVAA